MNLLLIETATQVCSVALATEQGVLASRVSVEANAHSTRLQVFIDEVLKEAGLAMSALGAVCVSAGPGSYTGLRIGVSAAKGCCYALGIPLVSVPTLLSMAALYYGQHPDYQGMVCPMIDARRMECYTMMVGSGLEVLRPTTADVIEAGLYDEFLNRGEVVFIGDGADKTRPLFSEHPHARYEEAFCPLAEGMLGVALERLQKGQMEDVAYFEPFYLKDFVARKSVVHGLYS